MLVEFSFFLLKFLLLLSKLNMAAIPGLGWANVKPVFQLGERTFAVPMSLHKAARGKICDEMKKRNVNDGVMLFCGGNQKEAYDSDHEPLFRQDSWFNYVFGVTESGCYGAIDIATGKTTLFIPRLPEEYRVIMGEIHPPERFKKLYDVDAVEFTDHFFVWLEGYRCGMAGGAAGASGEWIYLLNGVNSDSKNLPTSINFQEEPIPGAAPEAGVTIYTQLNKLYDGAVNMAVLFHALSTARVTKSAKEVELMWYTSVTSSNAHVEVMRVVKPGMMEYQLESTFMHEVYSKGGCRSVAYTCICGTGINSAVLHYGHAGAPNDRCLQPGDMALLDMGGQYHGYASDITCSYPVNGKFTEKQRGIYTGVLNAQIAVYGIMKVGTSWTDCHLIAEREILKQLLRMGVLVGGSPDDKAFLAELAKARVGAAFFPHGMGHLIGCDTHDVGGYIEGTPARSTEPGLRSLRTARILEANMVLTVEPGCYFIHCLLEKAFKADSGICQYFNEELIRREFWDFGGVRLEDDVQVMPDGAPPRNLTTCPRLIEEVEWVMGGGNWPPAVDNAPYLYRAWGTLEIGGKGMRPVSIHTPSDIPVPDFACL